MKLADKLGLPLRDVLFMIKGNKRNMSIDFSVRIITDCAEAIGISVGGLFMKMDDKLYEPVPVDELTIDEHIELCWDHWERMQVWKNQKVDFSGIKKVRSFTPSNRLD